jgi:hypothetical protein
MGPYRAYSGEQAEVMSALMDRALSETLGEDGLREIFAPLSRDDVYALVWVADQVRAFISNEFQSRPEE